MAAPGPSSRATPLAVVLCGTVLAAVSLGVVAPANAAAAASSTFENCTDKIQIAGNEGKAKFPKGATALATIEKVKITGCDMEITANRASATSFDVDNANWTLDGNVHIRSNQQQSRIDSDKAVVQFRNSEIQRITITGSPAQFEQKRPGTDQVTRGRAKPMVYEAGPGIVSLVDNAWLSDGNGREMESPGLWYDIRNQEMGYSSDKKRNPAGSAANSGDGESGKRIVITIDPKAAKKPAPASSSSSDKGGTPPAPPAPKP
jgi:lipopolysaccharide transport protein LptA